MARRKSFTLPSAAPPPGRLVLQKEGEIVEGRRGVRCAALKHFSGSQRALMERPRPARSPMVRSGWRRLLRTRRGGCSAGHAHSRRSSARAPGAGRAPARSPWARSRMERLPRLSPASGCRALARCRARSWSGRAPTRSLGPQKRARVLRLVRCPDARRQETSPGSPARAHRAARAPARFALRLQQDGEVDRARRVFGCSATSTLRVASRAQ